MHEWVHARSEVIQFTDADTVARSLELSFSLKDLRRKWFGTVPIDLVPVMWIRKGSNSRVIVRDESGALVAVATRRESADMAASILEAAAQAFSEGHAPLTDEVRRLMFDIAVDEPTYASDALAELRTTPHLRGLQDSDLFWALALDISRNVPLFVHIRGDSVERREFSVSKHGTRWTKVHVGGTAGFPNDLAGLPQASGSHFLG